MVKQNFLTKMLLLCALVVGSVSAWAQDPTLTIGFEDATYTDWTLTTIKAQQRASDVSAHGGSYFASTDGKQTGHVVTKEKIASPQSITFYISKLSTNTKEAWWYVKVSSDGTTWTQVGDGQAAGNGITKGVWKEVTRDLSSYSNVYVGVFYDGNTAARCIDDITITYTAASENSTSVTIDASSITNTNVFTDTEAGSLSATVKDKNGQAISGATVTWSGDDDDVAEIDESTGAVTLVAAGTVTFTASYAGVSGTYDASSATYTLTVTNFDPNGPGTENNPYSVAEAIEATPSSGTSDNVYITGIVSSFTGDNIMDDGNNYRYRISDDGTTTNELLVYRGKKNATDNFSDANDLLIGDVVTIYGGLTTYNGTKEVAAGNYIVSLSRKELSSISLSGEYPTTFTEGNVFSHEGMTVTATYSDNTTADVTDQAEFSGYDMNTPGVQTVTVSYDNKTATYDITVNALPTHTATFSVNGTTSTQDFKEGAAIVFPDVTAPAGFTFMGWTKTAITGNQAAEPADLTSEAVMGNADVTYYAVFAVVAGQTETATLTASHTSNNTTYADHTYTDDKGNEWSGNTNEPYDNGVARIGLRSTSGSYLESPTFSGNVTEIKIMTFNGSSSNRTFNIKSTKDGSADLGTVSAPANTQLTEEQTAVLTGTEFNKFFIVPTGAVGFSYIKVTYGEQTISDYCTTIPTSVTVTIASSGYTTLSSTHGLDFANATAEEAEDLIAYIIPSNNGVKLNKETVDEAAAGTGILLKGTPGATYSIPVKADAAEVGPNLLKAGPKVVEENNTTIYLLKSGKFRLASAGTTSVGKAYLELPKAVGAPALSIDGDDETTGINLTTVNGQQATDGVYYDLSGRRVAQPTKGVFIVNGKKVVIK